MCLHGDGRLTGHFVWVDPEFGLTADNVCAAEAMLLSSPAAADEAADEAGKIEARSDSETRSKADII